MNSTFEHLVREEESWEQLVSNYLPDNSRLVSCSNTSAFRRVYECDGSMYKIVKTEEPSGIYENTLAKEYELLKKLADSKITPRAVSYVGNEVCRILATEKMIGEQIGQFGDEFCRKKASIVKFLQQVVALNRRGIRHGDLTIGNVMFCEDNEVCLLDFDQAIETSVVGAITGDILGVGRHKGKHSALKFIVRVLVSRYRFLAKIGSLVGKLVGFKKKILLEPVDLKSLSPALRPLFNIWEQSRTSNANAPGLNISYYSLRVAGKVLPGERPWESRWFNINNAVDFEGKRLLELGCNLSILSCYAELIGGAAKGLAVDHDSQIIESAQSFSSAVGARTEQRVCDFDLDSNWEDQIMSEHFDIVSALSVMQWLVHKNRFLKFLSRFDEILYEGHESIRIEFDRLQMAGFRRIALIDVSERGRAVLYGRKS